MNKMPLFNKTDEKAKIIRILICSVAALALTAVISIIIRSIIISENDTQQLLARAFMTLKTADTPPSTESSTDVRSVITDTPVSTPPSTSSQPAQTTSTTPESTAPSSVMIAPADLSVPALTIRNMSGQNVNAGELVSSALGFDYNITSDPLVLILHTHTDECYAPENTDRIAWDYTFTSTDNNNNVVALGAEMLKIFTAAGISAIHHTSALGNYEETDLTVASYLRIYPSIKFIFDIHRDAIYSTDNKIVKTQTSPESPSAQIMLVVGTGESSSNPNVTWKSNLSAALRLQSMMIEGNRTLMRYVFLRKESLAQNYGAINIQLQIGSTGNSLSEAITAAKLAAKSIAVFIAQNANK